MENMSYDCRSYTANEILELLFDIYPEIANDRKCRKRIYVGATGNVKERVCYHKISIGDIIFCAQTAHRNVATKVEEIAHEKGFYIGNVSYGGNGTNSKSIYVYAYVITKDTVQ